MCHFMLPGRSRSYSRGLDGRYAVDALELFKLKMAELSTSPGDYITKVFGGGRMFLNRLESNSGALDVGAKNVKAARQLLADYGFIVAAEHLAGDGHRTLVFDMTTGDVWLRHCQLLAFKR